MHPARQPRLRSHFFLALLRRSRASSHAIYSESVISLLILISARRRASVCTWHGRPRTPPHSPPRLAGHSAAAVGANSVHRLRSVEDRWNQISRQPRPAPESWARSRLTGSAGRRYRRRPPAQPRRPPPPESEGTIHPSYTSKLRPSK